MKRTILILLFSFVAWQGYAQQNVARNQTYEYDELNRLTKVMVYEGTTLKFTTTYTYDEVGNRLTRVVEVFCDGMYSIVSGNWNTTTTWSCGRTPITTDDVTISAGHTVTIPAGQTGFLNSLQINGDLINNGSLKYKQL
jgi:hypothetical protein